MSLAAGARLGPYEVLAPLGAGGMGEVYRARDSRLNRDVAIKVLPELVATDPKRLARFQREAQLLAALNHPNIAHIHGLEDSAGLRALVMELVDGPTLADRIAAGPIPLAEVLPIARQIAEAVEAAHEQGIVHRDLKPSNIKVRDDGTVKVLDFGLAKLVGPDKSNLDPLALSRSPTLTAPAATMARVIFGTAAYMAPEQARGRAVDKRADIWAFGCVLYEMLTGTRAFGGDEITDTLAFIITKEPDWNALPPDTPASIRRLLRRCLQKDPRERLHDLADARLEISDVLAARAEDATAALSTTAVVTPGGRRRVIPWGLAGAFAAGLALTLLLWSPWRGAAPATPLRLTAELGVDASLHTDLGAGAILSPDGNLLAFTAQNTGAGPSQLYVRRLDQLQAAALPGTEDASSPFFSPDGQWIAFFAGGKLKKIAVTGGGAVTLADAPSSRGGAWGDDGTILFMPNNGNPAGLSLWRVSEAGGAAEPLTKLGEGEVTQRWPQVLPGSKAVLYTTNTITGNYAEASIVVRPLPNGAPKVVQRGGFYGRYLSSGHLLYVHDSTLFVAPFDAERLELTGQPVPAVEAVTANLQSGTAQVAVSTNGILIYVPGGAFSGLSAPIDWMTADGKAVTLRQTSANWSNPHFSPDGRRLAIDIFDNNVDVWVYEWARDALSRLTFDPQNDRKPVWTPDGRRIVFSSSRDATSAAFSNLYWQRADGTGEVQRLTESPNAQLAASWHPSGKFLAFQEQRPQTAWDLMILPIEGDEASGWRPGRPTVLLSAPVDQVEPMFSPDGRWVAYHSNESGRAEVYVRPFSGAQGKWLVLTGGGLYPTWSRTRSELFYSTLNTSQFMVVDYAVEGDSFRVGKPRLWSEARYMVRPRERSFDLHPDGKRIALAAVQEQAASKQDKVVLILNFFDELRRIAPSRN